MALFLYNGDSLDMIISGGRDDVDHWKESYERIVFLCPRGNEEEFLFPKEDTPQIAQKS